jgi:hypothetical protein
MHHKVLEFSVYWKHKLCLFFYRVCISKHKIPLPLIVGRTAQWDTALFVPYAWTDKHMWGLGHAVDIRMSGFYSSAVRWFVTGAWFRGGVFSACGLKINLARWAKDNKSISVGSTLLETNTLTLFACSCRLLILFRDVVESLSFCPSFI